MEKSDYEPNQRAHYRLRYPERERPVFVVGSSQYPVTELSEGGMRLKCSGLHGQLNGLLQLRDGMLLELAGDVGRQIRDETVLIHLVGVTFSVLIS